MKPLLLLGTAIPVLALAAASFVSLPKKLIYNGSQSAPIGVYWIDQKRVLRGDYALVRVPERVRELVEDRRYLPQKVPFLKRVVGLSGDEICRVDDQVLMNGMPIATAKKRDGQGRKLPDWQGCQILLEDSVFLLQSHPQSFDGRYFGPVDRALVIGRATRLRYPWR